MTAKKSKKTTRKDTAREWIKSIIIALILALATRATVVQAFRIPTSSMEETLLVGDFLLVNKFIYGSKIPFTNFRLPKLRQPKTGDIIVFKHPSEGKDFIKRCIGMPGDKVELRNDVVYVNDSPLDEPYKILHGYGGSMSNFGPVTVPEGHLFMMGDNRHNSYDSRSWGPLDQTYVKGKAMVIYFSWNKDSHFPRWTRFGKILR
ncbi:MAG: signal peptidase I [Candidatus Eisenbacteria bacterium]